MGSSDQDYILHPAGPHSKPWSPGKPAVNLLDYTLAKNSERNRVLTPGLYRQGQHCALFPTTGGWESPLPSGWYV